MNLVFIAALIHLSFSWRGDPTPNPPAADEQTDWHHAEKVDWTLAFDHAGWEVLPDTQLMYGFERSAKRNGDGISHIEQILTAEPGTPFHDSECTDEDWWGALDQTNSWAECPDNTALHGLYRSEGDHISNIEMGKCCPGVTTNCYEEQKVKDTLNYEGVSSCAPGHAMSGFYRGGCDELHCIEYFKCCRMTAFDPDDVHVIGYWEIAETIDRPLHNAITKTITVQMSLDQSTEVSDNERKDWQNEVSATNHVTVAVEASAEYAGVSGSLSSEYGYEHSEKHGEAFSHAVSNLAKSTFSQGVTITETFTIPAQEDGQPPFANRWHFTTKAIKPNILGTYSDATMALASSGITVDGCGYDVAPNCLPGHCANSGDDIMDKHCWKCEPKCDDGNCDYDYWKIDKQFVPPQNCMATFELQSAPKSLSAGIKHRFEAAQMAVDNTVGIENFSQKITKVFAFLGAGAILYGMTLCVMGKSEYTTIEEPEV